MKKYINTKRDNVFDAKANDWINTTDYTSLSSYEPQPKLTEPLKNRIDTEME